MAAKKFQELEAKEITAFPGKKTKEGDSIEGKLGERTKFTSKNYPEGLEYFELLDEKGVAKHYWMSGGLQGAFTMLGVQPGMDLKITYTGKEDFGDDGQTVNTYKIFKAV